ncbi:hypothetical protein EG329_000566 [Mollisiaceae sp. DMI_Dod_QoI]|nr:hypothetical protein EG329_000566 [Helotiales sp. DMI_Dod_QoI]
MLGNAMSPPSGKRKRTESTEFVGPQSRPTKRARIAGPELSVAMEKQRNGDMTVGTNMNRVTKRKRSTSEPALFEDPETRSVKRARTTEPEICKPMENKQCEDTPAKIENNHSSPCAPLPPKRKREEGEESTRNVRPPIKPFIGDNASKKVIPTKHDDREKEEEDEEDEDNCPNSQAPTLWSFLRNQELQSRASLNEDYVPTISTRRRRYDDCEDDGGFEYDSDYEDTDYDYDSGSEGDPDDEWKRREEEADPTFDPNFVAEEVSSGGKIKIPSYQPKAREQEEVKMEDDEERKAWKVLNAQLGEKVTSAASDEYVKWNEACVAFFSSAKIIELFDEDEDLSFPKIESEGCSLWLRDCVKGEKLGICQHDVLRVLKGSGVQVEGDQWIERLKRERLRWHPDKFSGKVGKQWEDESKEMFQMVQVLLEKEKK